MTTFINIINKSVSFAGNDIAKLDDIKETAVRHALKVTGCKTKAAKKLGIGRSTLYKLMKKYNINEKYIFSKKDYWNDL